MNKMKVGVFIWISTAQEWNKEVHHSLQDLLNSSSKCQSKNLEKQWALRQTVNTKHTVVARDRSPLTDMQSYVHHPWTTRDSENYCDPWLGPTSRLVIFMRFPCLKSRSLLLNLPLPCCRLHLAQVLWTQKTKYGQQNINMFWSQNTTSCDSWGKRLSLPLSQNFNHLGWIHHRCNFARMRLFLSTNFLPGLVCQRNWPALSRKWWDCCSRFSGSRRGRLFNLILIIIGSHQVAGFGLCNVVTCCWLIKAQIVRDKLNMWISRHY